MIYTTLFYGSLVLYIYQSITGNQNMIEQSFKAVVILGLTAILSSLQKQK